MASLQSCYEAHRDQLGAGRYDPVMQRLNNAYLAGLGTYNDWKPGFAQLYAEVGEDLAAFFAAVDELAASSDLQRKAALDALMQRGSARQQPVAHGADDNHAEEVQCQAFTNHFLDTDAPS